MKKIAILISFFFLLVSCGQSQSDIDAAKKKLLDTNTKSQQNTQVQDTVVTDPAPENKGERKYIQIIPLTEKQFLDFDSISESTLTSWEVKISGKTNTIVDKVQVLFSNPTSAFPDDDYVLQTFTSGDSEFKYFAASRHEVLDFGENNYIFTAYSGEEVSETKVVLYVETEEETQEEKGTESQLIGWEEDVVLIDLPTSSKYGEPMRLGETSFTYTQIKGLEVWKELVEITSCESLTDFLTKRMTSWYYWNTCRDIVKDKGIKFNVIRLEWENYIYERHYIDFIHGFYGSYELEKWTDVTSENIADKNTLLKDQEFPSIEIVDDLMKDIVNS